MSETYLITAKTVEEAIAIANREYADQDHEVSYEILEMPKKGFLGFGAKDATIKITVTKSVSAELDSLVSDIRGMKVMTTRGGEGKKNGQPKQQNQAKAEQKPQQKQQNNQPKGEQKPQQKQNSQPKGEQKPQQKQNNQPKGEQKPQQKQNNQPKAEQKPQQKQNNQPKAEQKPQQKQNNQPKQKPEQKIIKLILPEDS